MNKCYIDAHELPTFNFGIALGIDDENKYHLTFGFVLFSITFKW